MSPLIARDEETNRPVGQGAKQDARVDEGEVE